MPRHREGETRITQGRPCRAAPIVKMLDDIQVVNLFDGVAGDLAEGRRLMDAAASTDPEVG
jgi:hypothetical protein